MRRTYTSVCLPGEAGSEKLSVADILKLVGKGGLERVLARPGDHHQACSRFHPRGK
ncbi:MAG: hypothetical protein RQM92_08705 [Candidatus Syntrophopropionicum ammoniitolerans]